MNDEFDLDVRVSYTPPSVDIEACTDNSCPCYTLPCQSVPSCMF
ncbi:hypothetical protein ACFOVU_15485 [Nocardiopsis sediminis]|uniref:Uncharacterized protein n=1 Tax=Nocardiopsis sediminis TaxID=1778267 RepID=A0ABV8FQT4_9ACTN